MKIKDWLSAAQSELETTGITTARLDALILLEDVTGRDRAWLLANPDTELLFSQAAELEKLLKRRATHEPLAYIRGKTEFYGREFLLTPAVLEPRPESETMIDLLKELVNKQYSATSKVIIADVGSGSGALGITAALEVPKAQVELIEIDVKAMQVAKTNVDKFTLDIKLIESNLLINTNAPYNLLLCNLPYVPDDFAINLAARHEPKVAIFGGPDGLDIYRQLFSQLQKRLFKPLYILCESLPSQHKLLAEIAFQSNYKLIKTADFIQLFQLENTN
jgi:release factor glutamine methyltransferase